MKSIHSKTFLDVWHALHHDTRPNPTADHWELDGVDWSRETYGVHGRDLSFHIETHILTHEAQGAAAWSLLVVVERWWQRDRRDALKTTVWRHTLKGQDKQILTWFKRQQSRLEANFARDSSIL